MLSKSPVSEHHQRCLCCIVWKENLSFASVLTACVLAAVKACAVCQLALKRPFCLLKNDSLSSGEDAAVHTPALHRAAIASKVAVSQQTGWITQEPAETTGLLSYVSQKDSYPLPQTDEVLNELGKAKWLSKLDLKAGYWQIMSVLCV